MGGPVFKDKTFFFGDYQGHRETQGVTALSTVPTLRMRAGDFSELTRIIYDPTTPGVPFSGNVIPNGRIDTVARNILTQLYPEPNTTGTRQANGQTINNYLLNPIKNRDDNQFDVKVDHNLTDENRFFIRYSYQKVHRLQPASLPHGDAGATFGAGDGKITAQGLAFNDTHTIRPTVLNEFRFGWTSIKFFQLPIDYGTNPANAVGLPGVNLNNATSAMSQMTFQNIRSLGTNGNQPLITNQNDFQIFNNVTWIKGKHTIKSGGSITLRSREILNPDTITGVFNFQQQHDVELRRPARRVFGEQLHGLRCRELHARAREHEGPELLRRGHLHGNAARVRALCAGRLPRDEPSDAQPGAPVGRLPAMGRGRRSAVELRRSDGQVRGRF